MSPKRKDNRITQTEVNEAGVIVVASAWLLLYLVMIVAMISDQSLGRLIELAVRN
jgi:hypothetical protein